MRDLSPIIGAHFTNIGKLEQGRKKIELLEFIRYCNAIGADPHEGLDIMIQSISELENAKNIITVKIEN
jgi:hypothetical protein